jgi:thiamine pyrophosphokinase
LSRDEGAGRRAVVVLNGAFRLGTLLRQEFAEAFVVAADAGFRRLARFGIVADVIVGDFDSMGGVPYGVRAILHPVEKDETDGELALRVALEAGARSIAIVGAMGGRYDMALGHVALLRQARAAGARALLTDGRQAAVLVPRRTWKVGPPRATLSVVPLTPQARLASHGLKWPLDGIALRFDEMRGISNRIVDVDAWIRLTAGEALAILPYKAGIC